jgi:TrmH family RNA methyltransferase
MRDPEFITSPANPLLKEVRKAVRRGGLTDSGLCVAETFHLLEEALRSDCRVHAVIAGETVRPDVESLMGSRNGIRRIMVPDKLLDAASQGVVALVEPPVVQPPAEPHPLVLVIDGVQDPGNLGTILRSAEAFRASLRLIKGTVDPFNPKVIRASAGSIFRVHFVQGLSGNQTLAALRESGADLYSAVPDSTRSLADVDLTRSCAIE